MRLLRMLGILPLLLALSSCGDVDKITDSVKQAVAVLDQGIKDIQGESQNWQSVLQQVAQQLPKDISTIIQGDVQNLATRSIATAGIQFSCSVDFLANRAVTSLIAIKTALLNGTAPAPDAPTFCVPAPSEINLNLPPTSWASVMIGGYDMDHADASGRLVRFFTVDGNGTQQEIPESHIGRTTHYAITLNLGTMGKDIYQHNIAKIVTSWNNQPQKTNELVVISWVPQQRTDFITVSQSSYTPPKVGHGDNDFDVHGDRPMKVQVGARVEFNAASVSGVISMTATEPRPDYTEASGNSDAQVLYNAPAGWKITGVQPNAPAQPQAQSVTSNQSDALPLVWMQPAGVVVSQFDVWADHGGGEAGIWTRVRAHWQRMSVSLTQTAPAWAL